MKNFWVVKMSKIIKYCVCDKNTISEILMSIFGIYDIVEIILTNIPDNLLEEHCMGNYPVKRGVFRCRWMGLLPSPNIRIR